MSIRVSWNSGRYRLRHVHLYMCVCVDEAVDQVSWRFTCQGGSCAGVSHLVLSMFLCADRCMCTCAFVLRYRYICMHNFHTFIYILEAWVCVLVLSTKKVEIQVCMRISLKEWPWSKKHLGFLLNACVYSWKRKNYIVWKTEIVFWNYNGLNVRIYYFVWKSKQR